MKEPVRPHKTCQLAFRAILAEDIEWKPFAAFPPEARLAVLGGRPLEPQVEKTRWQISFKRQVSEIERYLNFLQVHWDIDVERFLRNR